MTENDSRNLYIVRHGQAKDSLVDPQRSLTENGRKTVEQIALLLGTQNLQINQIRHSGKTRAKETAEIMAQHLSPKQGITAIAGLAPNDDVNLIAETVKNENSTIMLVGHLPFLSRLASLLLLNNPEQDILHILPSSVFCLEELGGIWQLKWMLTPDLASY